MSKARRDEKRGTLFVNLNLEGVRPPYHRALDRHRSPRVVHSGMSQTLQRNSAN